MGFGHSDGARQEDRGNQPPWVELSTGDAERLGITDGDLVCVESPRGCIEAPARITGVRDGVVFAPFHYGYWDTTDSDDHAGNGHHRAANELTITDWDPVSKQPVLVQAAKAARDPRLLHIATGGCNGGLGRRVHPGGHATQRCILTRGSGPGAVSLPAFTVVRCR